MGALSRPEEAVALVKLRVAAGRIGRQIPPEEHWAFCYSMLQKVSRSFALVIQQLGPDLRNAVCIFYLVLRALDTVEDDTSIAAEVKVPILQEFYRHIYNRDWHYSCGTNNYRVLMDKFNLVSTAFLELGQGYQQAIDEITRRMGAGMAKFICKECPWNADLVVLVRTPPRLVLDALPHGSTSVQAFGFPARKPQGFHTALSKLPATEHN